jgi:AraC-like DNA-binding protein
VNTVLQPSIPLVEIPSVPMASGQGLTIDEADLIHVSAGAGPARFSLSGENDGRFIEQLLPAGQGLLLACRDASLLILEGNVEVKRLGVINFAKLLAFIDVVEPVGNSPQDDASAYVVMALDSEHVRDKRTLEYWFIRQVINGDSSFRALSTFLRRLENYWLVKYLVSESSQQKNVSDLGDEYGLSYSHFRRICKAALGTSVKSELKIWRAARSLLDVVGGQETMTEIAIRNGYASSSHFSTEIKNLFGLSPRAIMELKY